jgi:uncharacterized membrane protein
VILIWGTVSIIYSNSQGLWHDELYTSSFIQGSDIYDFEGSDLDSLEGFHLKNEFNQAANKNEFTKNFSRNIIHEGHPPLYFIGLKLWSKVAGVSDLSLRTFSIFLGLIFFVFWSYLVNKISKDSASYFVGVSLAVLNPFLFYFFNEARMYGIWLTLSCLIFVVLFKVLNTEENETKPKYWALLIVLLTLSLYTHYYSIFVYCIVISLVTVTFGFKSGFKKLIILSIPFLLFLPWLLVIKEQTIAHKIHWTDGFYGWFSSFIEFLGGLKHLIFFSGTPILNILGVLIICGLLVYSFSKISLKRLDGHLVFSISITIMLILVLLLDSVLDHHTISVPRYFGVLIIPILFYVLFLFNRNRNKTLIFCVSIILLGQTYATYKIASHDDSPKQMFVEVASYLDSKYDPETTKIIVIPRGPAVFGIARYLRKDFEIKAINEFDSDDLANHNYVIVSQFIGLSSYPQEGPSEILDSLRLKTAFVGLNVYE